MAQRMKRRHENNDESGEREGVASPTDAHGDGISANGIDGCVTDSPDTATTSAAGLSAPLMKRSKPKQQQQFSSIERLLSDDSHHRNGKDTNGGRSKGGKRMRKEEGTKAEEEEGEREGEGEDGRSGGGRRVKRMKTNDPEEGRRGKTTEGMKAEEEEERRQRREKEEEDGRSGRERRIKKMRMDDQEGRGKNEQQEADEGEEQRQQGKGRTSVERHREEEEEDDDQWRTNWLKAVTVPDRGSAMNGLNCELDNADTWAQFNQLGTEMIITKSGRRMFPVLRLRFSGTRPGCLYFVFMDVVPVERRHRFRYRYDKSQWQSAGKADTQPFGRLFLHNESPFSGEQLPLQLISFDKAKLTNNEKSSPDPDQLLLNSMHKYRPRVHVLCVGPSSAAQTPPTPPIFPRQFRRVADFDKLTSFPYKTFEFPETNFVAVTAYQNQLVTRKKIEMNPFAKGFRDQKGDDEEEENGGHNKNFLDDVTTADEWKTKRNGAEKREEKNLAMSPQHHTVPSPLRSPYRNPPPLTPGAPLPPRSVPCHHQQRLVPISSSPVPPPPLPLHSCWPPLLPHHLLGGLLFRIGANQQRQMRERTSGEEWQTEKGDE